MLFDRHQNDAIKSSSCRDDDDTNMTCGVLKFLHITAWHKTVMEVASDARRGKVEKMIDID